MSRASFCSTVFAITTLAACYSWSPDDRPLPTILSDQPGHLRVTLADSALVLRQPQQEEGLLIGFQRLEPRDTVRIAEIRQFETRHFELGRTATVTAIGIGVPILAFIVIAISGEGGVPLE